jgi:alkanesulfonate monooxygenase SsuD/methylene tetrahydromethanopterin reductase-like flavin-dependent oxidoreductase (luciferase family)
VQFVVVNPQSEALGDWAVDREAERWHGVAVSDHWLLEGAADQVHPFVALGVMAARTTTVGLSTSYANNLMRSPVEFAQAALTIHEESGGRFEAGLGAGWQAQELLGAGMAFPSGPERARRLREAVLIVRQLFRGACAFEGEYYNVELPPIGPRTETPPRLCAALGGPWTLRHVGPLVDTIEIATIGPAFRTGTADWTGYLAIQLDAIRAMIDTAHQANPTAAIGMSLFAACGTGPTVEIAAQTFAGTIFEGLAGDPDRVADAIGRFEDLDIDRLTILPLTDSTPELLASTLET